MTACRQFRLKHSWVNLRQTGRNSCACHLARAKNYKFESYETAFLLSRKCLPHALERKVFMLQRCCRLQSISLPSNPVVRKHLEESLCCWRQKPQMNQVIQKLRTITILLLFAKALLAQDSAQLQQQLEQKLQIITASHKGSVALYAENLKTGETVSINPDEEVTTASVIKLPVLFEALEQVRARTAKFDDKIFLKKENQVGGSGVLRLFDTPLALTLKDVLTMMIVMSDNTATNLAIDRLGLQNINSRIQWMGLKHTWLYKKVMRPASDPIPPDQPKFGLGKTTPREMAHIMKRIYRCELSGPGEHSLPEDLDLCSTAMTMLREQFYRNAVPRYIDALNKKGSGSGTAIGNKTGSLNKVRNDVALIASMRGPIIISAFTYDNQDQSWTADNEGELTISKLAQAIIQTWSPEGLSPNGYQPAPAITPAASAATP